MTTMLLPTLVRVLPQAVSAVCKAHSPPEFMNAARRVCELARLTKFAIAKEYRPNADLLRSAAREMLDGADAIRREIPRIKLAECDKQLVLEFADHIVQRSQDIEKEIDAHLERKSIEVEPAPA